MVFVSERDPFYEPPHTQPELSSGGTQISHENATQAPKRIRICQVFKAFPKFFTNRHTLRIIIYFMIKYIGINAIGPVMGMELTKYGFPPFQTAIVATLTLPLTFAICFLGDKFLKRGMNQRMCNLTFIFSIASIIAMLYI